MAPFLLIDLPARFEEAVEDLLELLDRVLKDPV